MSDFDLEKQMLEMICTGDQYLPEPVCRLDNVFCGCGCQEAAYEWCMGYLLDVINRVARIPDDDRSYGSQWISVYLMDHLGFTEHGTSVCRSWLTEDGMVLLGFLCRWGCKWREEARFISAEGVTYGRL